MNTNIINVSEGFTVDQVLSKNGFTLDTTDFLDLLDDEDDDFDKDKAISLTNREMMKILNLEDDEDINKDDDDDSRATFFGISFESLKSSMESIFDNGKILKQIKRKGIGEIIPPDCQVTVEYVGYFEHQDEPFDSTFFTRDKQQTFSLGQGSLIPGLEIAIKSMKKHELAIFIIQPELAYGKLGCAPRIPGDSEVLFKVELKNFIDNGSADDYNTLTNEDKSKFSVVKKKIQDVMNTAKDNFQRKKLKLATKEYNKAVSMLEAANLDNDKEEDEMNHLLIRALKNLMICYNKLKKPKLVCTTFQRIPNNESLNDAKICFQYGKALHSLGDYDKAMNVLQKAYKLESNSDEIRSEIKKVESVRRDYQEQMKRFAENSFKHMRTECKNEFEETVKNMCVKFIANESLMKQQLPEALTKEEENCIKKIAASYNITYLVQERFGKKVSFLTKTNL